MRSRHVHDNNRKITHWVKRLQGVIGRISGCPDQNLGIRNWSGISSISDWLVGSWNCRETVAKLPINKICTVPPISSIWKFYSKGYKIVLRGSGHPIEKRERRGDFPANVHYHSCLLQFLKTVGIEWRILYVCTNVPWRSISTSTSRGAFQRVMPSSALPYCQICKAGIIFKKS